MTPDDVRHGRATLEEAVRTIGWPRLGRARGRVAALSALPAVSPPPTGYSPRRCSRGARCARPRAARRR
ncbi:MAG: hypothetical protein E6J56_00480 [Deltaproteobacteria bacterium]|nr:MAG: hypothetical protein E6J56_00480 [Deltaproteobacteria bacterium]